MYVLNDNGTGVINGSYRRIAQLALRFGLPTTTAGSPRPFVAAGGLMAYGGSAPAEFHRAGYFVDRILRGTSPSEPPIEQNGTLDFVINVNTARALGLRIPPMVAELVTEWLE